MNTEELRSMVQKLVSDSLRLSVAHTAERGATVNYACIFTHTTAEFDELVRLTEQLGPVAQETSTWPVIQIPPLAT